jgi:hypothetical protein
MGRSRRQGAVRSHRRARATPAGGTGFEARILDRLSDARRDQAKTAVVFELSADRHEHKSIAMTANPPLSK